MTQFLDHTPIQYRCPGAQAAIRALRALYGVRWDERLKLPTDGRPWIQSRDDKHEWRDAVRTDRPVERVGMGLILEAAE